MKKNKTLLLTILTLCIITTVLAAYGSVLSISSGTSSYSPSTNKNSITHTAISKEQLADANKIKDIETTSISTINGKVEGRTGALTGNKTYDKVTHTYYKTPTSSKYATTEGYSKATYKDGAKGYDTDKETFGILGYTEVKNANLENNQNTDLETIFYERENLKDKEIQMLEEKNNQILFNTKSALNENIDLKKLTHINDIYVKEYPQYMEIYYEYIINHIKQGDYMPSGIYVDKNINKLYIVSISENKIYEYNIKK